MSTREKWRKGGEHGGSLQICEGLAGARPHPWGGQTWKRILSGTQFPTLSACCVCLILHTLPVMMGSFPHTLSVVCVQSLRSRSAMFAFATLPVVCVPHTSALPCVFVLSPYFYPALCVFPSLVLLCVCMSYTPSAVWAHCLHSCPAVCVRVCVYV